MSSILSFYAVSLILALFAFPLTFQAFPKARDRGFCSCRSLGLILATYAQSQLGRIGVNPWQTKLLFFPLIYIFIWLYWLFRNHKSLKGWIQESTPLLLVLEGAFLIIFAYALWVVAHNPGLVGTEKMMDFAILKTVAKSSVFPPSDPWLSGIKLNYYWFGHQSAALMGKLAGLAPEITYNLMLAYIFALAFQLSCGLFLAWGMNISQSLLGASLITLAGNLVPVYSFLNNHGDITLWAASRIIPNAITEFPLFSLIVGDLHAHFLQLPVYLLFIYWLAPITREIRTKANLLTRIVILNLLVLATVQGNPWALPAMFTLFFIYKARGRFSLPWFTLLPALLLLPLHWEVSGYPLAIGWVSRANSNPIGPFLLMWGIPLLLLSLYLSLTISDFKVWQKQNIFFILPLLLAFHSLTTALTAGLALAFWLKVPRENTSSWYPLATCGLLLLLIPELIFIKGAYGPPFERMNTIFKMYYAAWPLLMASTTFAAFKLSERYNAIRFQPVALLIALILATTFVFPGVVTAVIKRQPLNLSLNAFVPLRKIHPTDMKIIEWLDKNTEPGDICLEIPGESYTWGGRIAALSHCSTILGWRQHEALWHQNNPIIDIRAREGRQFFTLGKMDEKINILKKYKIKWVVNGELENSVIGNFFFKQFSQKIISNEFQWNDCAVYKVNSLATNHN